MPPSRLRRLDSCMAVATAMTCPRAVRPLAAPTAMMMEAMRLWLASAGGSGSRAARKWLVVCVKRVVWPE